MDEMTALRAMAERLAARGAGFGPILGAMGAADQPPPELLPGAVPDDWPATIPLPPGATIVGAVHWGASGPDRPAMTHLFVAAPRPPYCYGAPA